MSEEPELEPKPGQVWRVEHHHKHNYVEAFWLVVCADPLSEDLDHPRWILRGIGRGRATCANCDCFTHFLVDNELQVEIHYFPFQFYRSHVGRELDPNPRQEWRRKNCEGVTLVADSLEEYQQQHEENEA